MAKRDRYGRPIQPRAVSLEVAEQLLAERNALLERLKEADQELRQLEHTLRKVDAERKDMLNILKREHAQRGDAQANAERTKAELDATIAELEEARRMLSGAEHVAEPQPLADDTEVKLLQAQLQRLAADLANVKRRELAEIETRVRAERTRLVLHLVDVHESVDRALEASTDPESPWHAGLVGILHQVESAIRAEGFTLIGELDEPFDPASHEAVGMVESPDHAPKTVVAVQRPGLRFEDGTVARAALVVVSK